MGSNTSKDARKSSGTDDLESQRPPRMKEVNEELEEEDDNDEEDEDEDENEGAVEN